jgi:hypothetical protein
VIPRLLIALGLLALLGGVALIASFGTRLRVGRLIAGTHRVSLAELPAIAASGRATYVRTEGRVDSENEFEDAAHRPLVFRRTLVQLHGGPLAGWRTVDESREAVPFRIADASGSVAIAADQLDAGLVVIPREATGVAGDMPDRVPPGTPSDAPVRVRIQQISSVEHATVLGVPEAGPDGLRLRAAPGKPLVLTTLEQPEAMRILADGRQPLIRAAVVLFAAGCAAVAVGVVGAVLGLGG